MTNNNLTMITTTRFILFLIFLLTFLSLANSQTLSKQVIGFAGGTYENGNNKLSYTAGEVVVGAMTDEDATYQLGNGYYPPLDLSTLSTESTELTLQVKLYPNPVTAALFITHPTEQDFDIIISDINGKQIINTQYQNQQHLNVQTLKTGTYLVKVTTKDSKQTNTYKIIKK
jgi:hypothetical protein